MNYQNALDFFSQYSLPSLLIALTVAIIYFIVDKFLFSKITFKFKVLVPFFLGIIFYLLYDVIFVGTKPVFNSGTFSMGFVAGSLSSVMFAVIRRLFSKNGLKNISLSPIALLVESIIYPMMEESKLRIAVLAIEKLLTSAFIDFGDEQAVIDDIAEIINNNSDKELPKSHCEATAKLIVDGTNSLKEGQKH